MKNHSTSIRRVLVLAALLAGGHLTARAQTGSVGIGTTAPDASAALDVVSTSKGALLPRVADATAIATPATGLLVFQTGGTPGFYYNAGTPATPSWQPLATAAGAAPTVGDIKQGLQARDHAGWVKLDGRSVLTLPLIQRARAAALGLFTNLPDATDRVLKQKSGTLLDTGGSNTVTLIQGNLPDVQLRSFIASNTHSHRTLFDQYTVAGGSGQIQYFLNDNSARRGYTYMTSESNTHNHTATIWLDGRNTPFAVEDAYLNVNQFLYLGQ